MDVLPALSKAPVRAAFFALALFGWALAVAGQTPSFRDSLGRSVALPAGARRILSLQPEITRLVVALGAGGRLVGVDHFLRANDPLFRIIAPFEERLPLVSMADYNVNMEIVLRLSPDVIFGAPEDRAIVEALQAKTGVPTLALSSMGRFDGLLRELDLLGDLLDRRERAAELRAFFEATLSGLRRRLDAAGEPEPRVYLAFWGSATRTPVRYEPVEAAGGRNAAAGLLPPFLGTLVANVNLERVLAWDPDIILVHGNYPPRSRLVTTAQLLSDGRLSAVKAVKSGRVYYTFGFWNWWDPAEVLVETTYLAKLFHPALFPGFDLEAEGNAVFKKFYGVAGAFTALSETLGCGAWLDAR